MYSIREIICFLDDHSGSLTVLITAVYVIATILICWANIKSANAAKTQLAEMKRQYDEENRPYITIEVIYEKRCFYGLRFTNHGKRIANHVRIDLGKDFLDSLTDKSMKELLEAEVGKECIIGVGQHYDLFFGTREYWRSPHKASINGSVSYMDGIKPYEDAIDINLIDYATFFSTNSEAEDFLKKVDTLNQELKEIKRAIECFSFQNSVTCNDPDSDPE